MSLLAIDIGNCNIVATVPRGKGIDVVTSDTSNKQIPCVVSYQNHRRYFTDQAAAQKISNRQGCFYYLPLILSEKFDSPMIQRAMQIGAQYPLKASPTDGRAVASVTFGDEQLILETDQICAAMANKVKQFAESMDNVTPKDVITTVPAHWCAEKRAAMRAAIESTGLVSLGVVSQHIAAGVGYYIRRIGTFQSMAADAQGVKLALMSIGEVESWFAVLQMNKAGVTTLGCSCDATIGSVDFDLALVTLIERMALASCKQITLDELRTKKTQIKILKAANALKKSLTMNRKAQATLECVGDNQVDIPILVNLEDFEKIVDEMKLIEKIKVMVEKGLNGVEIKDIEAIECIGGASRVKSIQTLITQMFTEQKVSKMLNPDEAIGFGLGWIGAIRSSKYRIPYEIAISDITANLREPVTLHVINEKNEQVLAKPLEMFKNNETFPKSKKVTLRFAPGAYKVQLKEGDFVHEETTIQLKPKNFEQFTDKEMAKAAGVDFEDQMISTKVKVIADNDGYFKFNGLTRTELEVVFDDKKTMIPNEKYDELNSQREAEIKKREEEYTAKMAEYEPKQKKFEEDVKAQEEEKKKPENKDKKDWPKLEAPEKPVKPINPPEIPKEVERIDKVPRIANMSQELNAQFVSGVYNVQERAQALKQFELKCQKVDEKQLQFDTALNGLETIIYNARDGVEYGLKPHITEEEAQQILQICEEAHEYAQAIEGVHQIEDLKKKAVELEAQFKSYYDRKKSHADLEDNLYRVKSDFENMKARYTGAENEAIRTEIDKKLNEYKEKAAVVDQKVVVPEIFADLETVQKEFEKKLLDNFNEQKKKDEEAKKKEEEAKKAEEAKKKEEEAKNKPETPQKAEEKPEEKK